MFPSNIHLVSALIADEERRQAAQAARARSAASAESVDRWPAVQQLIDRLTRRAHRRAPGSTTPLSGRP